MPSSPAACRCLLGLVLVLLLARASFTVGQVQIPTKIDCPSSANNSAATTTPFLDNVVALMEVLPSAAAAAGGFATNSTGTGADRAFVRGLCRGDVAPRVCRDCLHNASIDLLSACMTARRGGIWYERCYLFFADSDASTTYEETHREELQNAATVADRVTFERTYYALMSYLSARVVNGTPESSTAAPMFATGHTVFDPNAPNGTVYGLVQCMRDRTAAECARCLQDSVPHLPECCSGRQGGLVLGYNCFLRMEVYTYYDLALDGNRSLQLPLAPIPSPPGLTPLPEGRQELKIDRLWFNCELTNVNKSKTETEGLFSSCAAIEDPSNPTRLSRKSSTFCTYESMQCVNHKFILFGLISTGKKKPAVILGVVLPVATILVVVGITVVVCLYKRKARQKASGPDDYTNEEDIGFVDQLEHLNLQLLKTATDNFSKENKLGEGGFGEVFKGTLKAGEQIAVKRLSKKSSQGFHELKNELVLAAKLKHKNLAPLVGVCLQQQEKLLVYEYMPNSSLDTFLFDPVKRLQLDWGKRFTIICGIARGLRYLHEESRLKVIHRDLKPSNVLLDADMNPKISDFGLARAFGGDQSRDVTRRPAGTLGYMSPEYAYCGHVSTKSDMFSFGVIVLEMITGRKSNSTYECLDSTSLLSYAWKKWSSGSGMDVVDASLLLNGQQNYPESEVLNCLEVGLLCVQENPADRPDASEVVLLLGRSSNSTMADQSHRREPSRPAFFFGPTGGRDPFVLNAAANSGGSSNDVVNGGDGGQPPSAPSSSTGNVMTISDFQPR